MARRHPLMGAALAWSTLLAAGCAREPEIIPPDGEVLVFVDTDVAIPGLASRLQVDVYDDSMQWISSRDILRDDPVTWPVSFTLERKNPLGLVTVPSASREIFLRLRLYPDGKTRDYRGEKFFAPRPDDDPATCPLAPPEGYADDKYLQQRDASGAPLPPVHPLREPLPELAIDRLLRLRIEPGKQGSIGVVLHGACFGKQANLFDRASCVDDEQRYVPVVDEVVHASLRGPGASLVGSFPSLPRCDTPLRPNGPFDEEVCVDGGAFILGDQAVFGYGEFDGFPEHVAIVPPLVVDRFEVTVGRFREALSRGALPGVTLPVANDGPLATSSGTPELPGRCTFSTAPSGREDYPLNCVTFETARAFCKAEGGDLPTEAEWEWLAAAAGRAYQDSHAWGSTDPTCDTAVFARADNPFEGADDCVAHGFGVQRVSASTPGDVTPVYGIVGLAGNVREWTRDSYRAYCSHCWRSVSLVDPVCDDAAATARTVRGSDYTDPGERLLAGLRDQGLAPDATSSRVGFRCVRRGAP